MVGKKGGFNCGRLKSNIRFLCVCWVCNWFSVGEVVIMVSFIIYRMIECAVDPGGFAILLQHSTEFQWRSMWY